MGKKAAVIKERIETEIQGNVGKQLVELRSETARVSAIAETLYARLTPILNDGVSDSPEATEAEDIAHPNCPISEEISKNIENLYGIAETLGAILDRLEV